ncbi:MAG: hypothetical protein RhofKO_24870 [Rhodothermales bacterium]
MAQPNLPASVADHPLVAELSKQLNPLLKSMLVERALNHVGTPEAVAEAVLNEAPEQVLAVAQAAEQNLATTIIDDMQADPNAWAAAVVARLDFEAPALQSVYEQVKARVLQQMVEQALHDLSTALADGEMPAVATVPDESTHEVLADTVAEEAPAPAEAIEALALDEAGDEAEAEELPTPEAQADISDDVSTAEALDEGPSDAEDRPVQTAYLGPEQPTDEPQAEAPIDDFFNLDDLEAFVEPESESATSDELVGAAADEVVEADPSSAPAELAFSEEAVADAVQDAIAAEADVENVADAIEAQPEAEPVADADVSSDEARESKDEAPQAHTSPLTKVDVPADQPAYAERYVYALSIDEHDLLSLIELPDPVIEDGQYEIIRQGDLSAIVSTVPADAFGPEVLRTKFSDAEWMTHYVGRHEAVVAAVAEKMPTMPLRFATVLPNREAVQTVLREHEAEWKARVRSLHQTATFQVRLVRDDEQVRILVVDQSERVLFYASELEGATGKGAADLRQRMLESINEEIEQRTQVTAQRLAEVLEQHAVVSRGLPAGEGVCWHHAYLVGQTDLSLFTDEVEALQGEYSGTGFSIVAQGPQWPYAFVPSVARPAAMSQAA